MNLFDSIYNGFIIYLFYAQMLQYDKHVIYAVALAIMCYTQLD